MEIDPLQEENVKKIGVLSLKKPFFRPSKKSLFKLSFSLERDFDGLNNNFLSDKTPIFLTFSTHKGSPGGKKILNLKT